VPKVLGQHLACLDAPDSWLLLEHIEGVDLHAARQHCHNGEYEALQEELAEICSCLHNATADAYQRASDPESPKFGRWSVFFRHIYDGIWQDVQQSRILSTPTRRKMSRIHERLDELLEHDDRPRLVHGDFWACNVLVRPDARGRWRVAALLDPNLKYAHAEAELAYLELFHTITPAFLRRYQKEHPMDDGYHRHRRGLYHLYDLLDHVHLFGQEYVRPFVKALGKVGRV
jgi:fructosamine-3-kinase